MNTLIVLSLLIIRMVASFINDLLYLSFLKHTVEETSFIGTSVELMILTTILV
jgi:hypothetical protein